MQVTSSFSQPFTIILNGGGPYFMGLTSGDFIYSDFLVGNINNNEAPSEHVTKLVSARWTLRFKPTGVLSSGQREWQRTQVSQSHYHNPNGQRPLLAEACQVRDHPRNSFGISRLATHPPNIGTQRNHMDHLEIILKTHPPTPARKIPN